MVLDYEFGWGDDPCDLTTEIVEKLSPKSILQVVGSSDHLLSFMSVSKVKNIVAFDLDERALALCDLKLSGIKNLNYDIFTRFFNAFKFREFIEGEHNHPILDPNNILTTDQFINIYQKISKQIKPEWKKIIDENIEFSETPGYHCINTFHKGAKLANPIVIPWMNKKQYQNIKNKNVKIELYKASLDSYYDIPITNLLNNKKFDLIWPIDALDNNVDIKEFVNLCLNHNSSNGYVMIHFGIKDPYIFYEQAFPDIMNIYSSEYKTKMESRGNAPIYVVSIEDLFTKIGYKTQNDLLKDIENKYFPRETNTWWDLDINEAWSPEYSQNIKSVLYLGQRMSDIKALSSYQFINLIKTLPKYFKRGLMTSSGLENKLKKD